MDHLSHNSHSSHGHERKSSLSGQHAFESGSKQPPKRVSFSNTNCVIHDSGEELVPVRHRDSITSASTDSSEDSNSSGENRLSLNNARSKMRARIPVTTGTTRQISEMCQLSLDGSSISSCESRESLGHERKSSITSPIQVQDKQLDRDRRKSAPALQSGAPKHERKGSDGSREFRAMSQSIDQTVLPPTSQHHNNTPCKNSSPQNLHAINKVPPSPPPLKCPTQSYPGQPTPPPNQCYTGLGIPMSSSNQPYHSQGMPVVSPPPNQGYPGPGIPRAPAPNNSYPSQGLAMPSAYSQPHPSQGMLPMSSNQPYSNQGVPIGSSTYSSIYHGQGLPISPLSSMSSHPHPLSNSKVPMSPPPIREMTTSPPPMRDRMMSPPPSNRDRCISPPPVPYSNRDRAISPPPVPYSNRDRAISPAPVPFSSRDRAMSPPPLPYYGHPQGIYPPGAKIPPPLMSHPMKPRPTHPAPAPPASAKTPPPPMPPPGHMTKPPSPAPLSLSHSSNSPFPPPPHMVYSQGTSLASPLTKTSAIDSSNGCPNSPDPSMSSPSTPKGMVAMPPAMPLLQNQYVGGQSVGLGHIRKSTRSSSESLGTSPGKNLVPVTPPAAPVLNHTITSPSVRNPRCPNPVMSSSDPMTCTVGGGVPETMSASSPPIMHQNDHANDLSMYDQIRVRPGPQGQQGHRCNVPPPPPPVSMPHPRPNSVSSSQSHSRQSTNKVNIQSPNGDMRGPLSPVHNGPLSPSHQEAQLPFLEELSNRSQKSRASNGKIPPATLPKPSEQCQSKSSHNQYEIPNGAAPHIGNGPGPIVAPRPVSVNSNKSGGRPPPPPPKRSENTRLSVDIKDVTNSVPNHCDSLLDAHSECNNEVDLTDLPLPPPEMLEGFNNAGEDTQHRKPPPPPPKRNRETQLSVQ